MKKLILSLLSVLLFFNAQAQEVLPQQQTLITKIAATWCLHCGTWGWAANDAIIADNPSNAIIMTAHHSGSLSTQVAKDFTENFKSIGQPQFFLNNTDVKLYSTNTVEKVETIKAAITANALLTPLANTGILYQLDGQELTSIVKTKFFQAAEGEFYVGTYLVEEGVLSTQEGQEGIVAHKNILRAAFTEDSFGRPIQTPIPITADATFSQINTLILEDSWNKEQLEIVTIIWKKEGDTFEFVNGSTMQVVTPTNIVENPEPATDTTTSTVVNFNALDFSQFPWLDAVVDTQDCCDIKTIKVYTSGIYQYVYLERDSTCASKPSALYFQDGTFYCQDLDCRSSYGLTIQNLAMAWNCTAEAVEEIEVETPTGEPETENEPDFSDYPWLTDVLATYDCCATVTAYMSGIYNFIFITPSGDCTESISQLYFQDGTFYCGNATSLDCREAYSLSNNTARVLATCADTQ